MRLLLLLLVQLVVFGRISVAQNKTININWDQSTLRQITPLHEPYANYGRIIQLQTGSLLCIYESKRGIECIKSIDLGKTWADAVLISENRPGINMAVPEIIELKDHSLLVSYNPRPKNGKVDTTKHFGIRTKKSYDEGKTWQDERLVYEASYKFEDGCWEPAQIQLPSGEIQLFFSDEKIYNKSGEQNISIFRSKDAGLTWTKKPEIVSFTANHRDGMPVPVLLNGSKEILFSIEDNSNGQFKPSIIRNTIKENWRELVNAKSNHRNDAFTPNLPDSVYAGAPYLRQLKSGETILSFQSTLNRNKNWELAFMQVAIGDKNGRNFKLVDNPFNIPLDKHGLWNAICVLNDDTIIALTSTNAFGQGNSIWMIKGKLIKE